MFIHIKCIRELHQFARANERNWNDRVGVRHPLAKEVALSVDQILSHARAKSMTLSRVCADLTP